MMVFNVYCEARNSLPCENSCRTTDLVINYQHTTDDLECFPPWMPLIAWQHINDLKIICISDDGWWGQCHVLGKEMRTYIRQDNRFSLTVVCIEENLNMFPGCLCSVFFTWCRAPQQMLRTHHSLKVFCATLWWRWAVFFTKFYK
jgi:hypothetical protein